MGPRLQRLRLGTYRLTLSTSPIVARAKDVPFEQPMITSPEVDGGIEFETEEGGIETGVVSKVDDNGLVTVSHSGGKGDSTVSPDKIRRLISKEQLEAARKQAEQQAQEPAPKPPRGASSNASRGA